MLIRHLQKFPIPVLILYNLWIILNPAFRACMQAMHRLAALMLGLKQTPENSLKSTVQSMHNKYHTFTRSYHTRASHLWYLPTSSTPTLSIPTSQFPFGQLPTSSIPTLSISIWSMLTKWELTKWELTNWELTNWELTNWELTKWE